MDKCAFIPSSIIPSFTRLAAQNNNNNNNNNSAPYTELSYLHPKKEDATLKTIEDEDIDVMQPSATSFFALPCHAMPVMTETAHPFVMPDCGYNVAEVS
jgi:hypothetical protein